MSEQDLPASEDAAAPVAPAPVVDHANGPSTTVGIGTGIGIGCLVLIILLVIVGFVARRLGIL
ncbi:MAG: hypothetical protein QM692_02700 [Thermomicrobiales bacterium]